MLPCGEYATLLEEPPLTGNEADCIWYNQCLNAEASYKELLSLGWSPQKARSVLPNSLKTEIVMSANLREWRHFFMLRTSPKAHPQMQEIAIPMLLKFQELVPVLFDDIAQE
jgi:thymidylate synthase (FAD)